MGCHQVIRKTAVIDSKTMVLAGNHHAAIIKILHRMVGTVVASRKEDVLEGMKFLLVKACDFDGNPKGATVVAVDAVGAGVGEVVLWASGSSARPWP